MAQAHHMLNRIMDRVDKELFKAGLVFREDKEWTTAAAEIAAWVYRYYDDEDQDNSYDPEAEDSDGEALTEESASVTLDESETAVSTADSDAVVEDTADSDLMPMFG